MSLENRISTLRRPGGNEFPGIKEAPLKLSPVSSAGNTVCKSPVYGTIIHVSGDGTVLAVVDNVSAISEKRVVIDSIDYGKADVLWVKEIGSGLFYVGFRNLKIA